MQRRARIICLGAVGLDRILRVPHLPAGSGKILPTQMVEVAEGMAASAAAAAVRLGADAALWARVGDDETGRRIRKELAGFGVDVGQVRAVAGARSVVSTILVAPDGERLVLPFYDPRLGQETGWLDLGGLKAADAVLADVRWPEGAALLLSEARRLGLPAVLDCDVGPRDTLSSLADLASHAVFSEPAAASLAGETRAEDNLRSLADRHPGFVAVTAGERGCLWYDRAAGEIKHAPAPRISAVDTLAAGDVFHGAFTLRLAEGASEPDAIAFANVAAALKCETFGGWLGTPTRAKVEERLLLASAAG